MSKGAPKILIISSCRLSQGPAAIAGQYYDAFCQEGYDTDLLLKYPEPDHPEYMYVVDESYEKSLFYRIRHSYLWKKFFSKKKLNNKFYLSYSKEKYPPIPSKVVVNKISKKYDLILIVFWQGLLSFETIQRIYDKLHCQIHIMGVDYSQMSGGCHFPGSCDNYVTGCGMCPAICSTDKNDFTAWNVRYRKKVYKKVKPIVYGNQYMHQFYKKSYLLKDANCELIPSIIIDTKLFQPLDSKSCREKYHIPKEKYILFFACQNLNDYRKGISYLLEALIILNEKLGEEKNQILVITAGNGYEEIKTQIPFESMGMGYVPMERLPEIFALSTCFICPSIDDAGPMMVNQSLCCGKPVVGFEIGSVLQVVKDKGTGYCVPLKDVNKMSDKILEVLKLSTTEYQQMQKKCREVALQTSSYTSQVKLILDTYTKYSEKF